MKRKFTFSVSTDAEDFRRLDKARGHLSRSTYVMQAVRHFMDEVERMKRESEERNLDKTVARLKTRRKAKGA